ncbi:hypothetical protein TREMEDRAFT_64982 [Tremella mesenterica DSM 1558]|uniref:uncharacterized protein n=1 Tax=Tremella mesenterica (strain ATCC 24925 / CBS 8224 / DSM 1558 / NBRC 9311 / NRRL Y-6157 / RJB 2259-6 / UBC 559-6) TaxID=578456 RepID=UPI0003F492A1|nr:uncharacterized protein TREMEDRAFT_64982 [Tremella mesenterica DSM 1558]EIW67113.1 hypothetical protein TREMEDRAFT_64982 [Tremella mesenterica DSM 1558]
MPPWHNQVPIFKPRQRYHDPTLQPPSPSPGHASSSSLSGGGVVGVKEKPQRPGPWKSAAEEAWNIPLIRRNILRNVKGRTVTKVMVLSKNVFLETAEELYRFFKYAERTGFRKCARSLERYRFYSSLVQHIEIDLTSSSQIFSIFDTFPNLLTLSHPSHFQIIYHPPPSSSTLIEQAFLPSIPPHATVRERVHWMIDTRPNPRSLFVGTGGILHLLPTNWEIKVSTDIVLGPDHKIPKQEEIIYLDSWKRNNIPFGIKAESLIINFPCSFDLLYQMLSPSSSLSRFPKPYMTSKPNTVLSSEQVGLLYTGRTRFNGYTELGHSNSHNGLSISRSGRYIGQTEPINTYQYDPSASINTSEDLDSIKSDMVNETRKILPEKFTVFPKIDKAEELIRLISICHQVKQLDLSWRFPDGVSPRGGNLTLLELCNNGKRIAEVCEVIGIKELKVMVRHEELIRLPKTFQSVEDLKWRCAVLGKSSKVQGNKQSLLNSSKSNSTIVQDQAQELDQHIHYKVVIDQPVDISSPILVTSEINQIPEEEEEESRFMNGEEINQMDIKDNNEKDDIISKSENPITIEVIPESEFPKPSKCSEISNISNISNGDSNNSSISSTQQSKGYSLEKLIIQIEFPFDQTPLFSSGSLSPQNRDPTKRRHLSHRQLQRTCSLLWDILKPHTDHLNGLLNLSGRRWDNLEVQLIISDQADFASKRLAWMLSRRMEKNIKIRLQQMIGVDKGWKLLNDRERDKVLKKSLMGKNKGDIKDDHEDWIKNQWKRDWERALELIVRVFDQPGPSGTSG